MTRTRRTHAAGRGRRIGRKGDSEQEVQHRPAHPLLTLQSQVGNRAVSRLVAQRSKELAPGAPAPIQRFAFANPDWNATRDITRFGDGARGAQCFTDGTDLPLVTKASNDPPRETTFATIFYNKFGNKRNISAPPTRVATDIERARIAAKIQEMGQYDPERKQADIEAFLGGEPHAWIMGLAKGKTFGSKRKMGEGFTESPMGNETVQLLEDPDYVRRLGFVTTCDLFLGNPDRIDVGNLGNWLTDESRAIGLIDNYGGSYQMLTSGGQAAWQSTLMPDLKPSNYKQKGGQVYDSIVNSFTPDLRTAFQKSLTMSPQARREQFAIQFAKGMAEGRKKILDKLAPVFGKRSRTIKQAVTAGAGGEDAWRFLKQRVQLFKNLK